MNQQPHGVPASVRSVSGSVGDRDRAPTIDGHGAEVPGADGAEAVAGMDARREAMVARLVGQRVLTDPAWRPAFAGVARHVFLPWVHPRRPRARLTGSAWADAVYSDAALTSGPEPTTRLTAPPAVVARTLDALTLAPPHHPPHSATDDGDGARRRALHSEADPAQVVLHLASPQPDGAPRTRGGGDDGWITALLCRRFGDEHVTRLDTAPDALDVRARLALVGHHPLLHLALTTPAALAELGDHSFTRLLATTPVDVVPPSWIAQLRPGGRIVASVASATVCLDVHDDGHAASGRFLPATTFAEHDPLTALVPDPAARLWIHLTHPEPLFPRSARTDLEDAHVDVRHPQGDADPRAAHEHRRIPFSGLDADLWARRQADQRMAEQIRAGLRSWRRLGEPSMDQIGLTITPSGQRVWHDTPHRVLHETPHPTPRPTHRSGAPRTNPFHGPTRRIARPPRPPPAPGRPQRPPAHSR